MPTVLAIAAHPDDIEFLMAGTMLRLRDEGYDLHYMNLANGCCGSTTTSRVETARIREQEARAAADHLNAKFYPPICDDLAVFYDETTLARVAAVVRQAAPDILLTHAPADYMEDHVNTCRLAVTAAFSRGMPNFPTLPEIEPITKPVVVYHAQPYGHHDPLGEFVHPQIFVDVSSVQDEKAELLGLHASQKQWLDESQGLDSYLKTMRDLDAELGRRSVLFTHAEGWRRHLHLGLCAPDANPLLDVLGERAFVRPKIESSATDN